MLTNEDALSAEREDKTILQKGTGTDSSLGWQSKNEGQELEQEAERKKEHHEQYNRSSWIQHCPSTLFKHPHSLF